MNADIIARDLLKIQAVFFRPDEPFTWASGIKSPVYCDNRLTLTAPQVRLDVETGLSELVREYYPEAEVLMGTSTAGIAHAAITAHLMGLPMATSARGPRITAGRTRSRVGWSRDRRWSSSRTSFPPAGVCWRS